MEDLPIHCFRQVWCHRVLIRSACQITVVAATLGRLRGMMEHYWKASPVIQEQPNEVTKTKGSRHGTHSPAQGLDPMASHIQSPWPMASQVLCHSMQTNARGTVTLKMSASASPRRATPGPSHTAVLVSWSPCWPPLATQKSQDISLNSLTTGRGMGQAESDEGLS